VGLGTAPSSSPPVGPWAPVISVKMVPVLVGGNTQQTLAKQASSICSEPPTHLPEALRRELIRLAPEHAADCWQLFQAVAESGDTDRTRLVTIIALKMLVCRIEQGNVQHPPGLLRMKLIPEAESKVDATLEELAALRATVLDADATLIGACSGFQLIRQLRARDLAARAYSARHLDALGAAPPEVTGLDATSSLGSTIKDAHLAIARERIARGRGDALAENRAAEDLHRIERTLDELLKGAAE
jgi:hypothetical protein